jgi:hypothetical protein
MRSSATTSNEETSSGLPGKALKRMSSFGGFAIKRGILKKMFLFVYYYSVQFILT